MPAFDYGKFFKWCRYPTAEFPQDGDDMDWRKNHRPEGLGGETLFLVLMAVKFPRVADCSIELFLVRSSAARDG